MPPENIRRPVDLSIESLKEWEGNPNTMSTVTETDLQDDIVAHGFDEPIGVIPEDRESFHKEGFESYVESGGKFVVHNGNHRLKACRNLGYLSVPCVVHEDWSENDAAIALVRRNVVRGYIDPKKMVSLVDDHFTGIDKDILARQMGFEDDQVIFNLYDRIVEEDEDVVDSVGPSGDGDGSKNRSSRGEATESLAAMLSSIMSAHGETVEQGFMCFTWKQQSHLLVLMDDSLRNKVGLMAHHMEDRGLDAARVFHDLVASYLKKSGLSESDGV